MRRLPILLTCLFTLGTTRAQQPLIRFDSHDAAERFETANDRKLELVSEEGLLYRPVAEPQTRTASNQGIRYAQPDREWHFLPIPSVEAYRATLLADGATVANGEERVIPDPPIESPPAKKAEGPDPKLDQSWGLRKVGAIDAWQKLPQGKDIVVAVLDTGIDYNHPDLIDNMWRNPDEIPGDKIDNDKNGYIDDVVGWDFAENDGLPYDRLVSTASILLSGGNPGHGTHIAGVIGATLNNAEGISGVAPKVKIMALRFLTQDNKGWTSAAIRAIDYAISKKVNIINTSWGAEKGVEDDLALSEAIGRAEKAGILIVAAAGNGRRSKGYDNDTDPKPIMPASLENENIISVAAVDETDSLGKFSNWGKKSVDIAAPGVKIFSTVPKKRYQDTIINNGKEKKVIWDGTSMAAPFVTGALAVLWSQDPTASWKTIKEKLLSSGEPVKTLADKVASGSRLKL